MMARYRRMSMAIRPVNRIKHVVDTQHLSPAGTQVNTPLVTANDDPVLANRAEVLTGSKVNGVYLRVEVASNETNASAITQIYMIITKNPGGNITIPTANAVGLNDNKRYVIHQEMVMLQNAVAGNPRTLFNGVIVIPKGFRRFGPNDTLVVSTFVPTGANDTNVCMQMHYKEFR